MWRFALIAAYVVFGITGIILTAFSRSRWIGWGLFCTGMVCIAIHMILDRRDKRIELQAQAEWISAIQVIADDLSLEGYGIPTLTELAHFNDAAGREEILAALKALPQGRRSLLAAAQAVDPDAEWD